MALAINQFMWQWQPHFRIDVDVTMRTALELLGAPLDPAVFLVGFATDPKSTEHPICVEPETGPLSPAHLRVVAAAGSELFDADPERQIYNTDPGVHERRQRLLFRRARAQALSAAIEDSGVMPGRRVISSSGGQVPGFEVHTCVAVNAEPFDSLPRLVGEDVNRFPAPGSLVGHLIDVVLREADIALQNDEVGPFAIRRRADDLIQEAAENFLAGCSYRTKNFRSPHVLPSITDISQRRYEGAGAHGHLLLTHPEHPGIEHLARLVAPVPLSSVRRIRKLLEVTDHDVALLVHEEGAFGIGRLIDDTADDIFEIRLTAHATYEVSAAKRELLRVSYGVPELPEPLIDMARIADVCDRVLGGTGPAGALLDLVQTAARAGHGTTLVISEAATTEADRLASQATLIDPTVLTPELLTHVARIDGAVLIDPAGTCCAIGVILDGDITEHGDPGRGARYNSALRYQRAAARPTVVVIVSEDGDVTWLPALRARVRRQQIADSLALLDEAAASDEPGRFSDAYEQVNRLAFYLTPQECSHVNELADAQHDRALQSQSMVIVRPAITANPELDDSYFVD